MRILVVITLVIAGESAVYSAEPASAHGLRLDGGFIQYQEPMLQMTADAWTAELDAMRRLQMHTIVIQWLRHNQVCFMPADHTANDPTEAILSYADSHGMEVVIGLATDREWWRLSADAAYLAGAASTSIAVADEAWQRYGRHRSLAGWYLPQETSDQAYDDAHIEQLKSFFRRISDHCKQLSGDKPVAIAPFFTHNQEPEVIERVYTRILDGAGIDLLMVQDGVGARGWGDDVTNNVMPSLRAFRDACLATGTELWADVESFAGGENGESNPKAAEWIPADCRRIARQLSTEAPFVRRMVTFDFFHYMSPLRGRQQKILYDAYLHDFVERDFLPQDGRSVQIDPLLPYYKDRSEQSIAAELHANGYSVAHYILTADSNIRPALIDALHREHIGVWYATFANGTYSTRDLPIEFPAWKMVTRSDLANKPLQDGYTRLCLNNMAYRAWKRRQIIRVLRAHPFEGIDIMEPHWPEYPGPESPAYACFCSHCLAAFRRMFPAHLELPDVLNADSPRSPAHDPSLWKDWLEFRRNCLADFLNDLVNGQGGIREQAPRARVCTWTLALTLPDGLRRVREDSGEDAAAIARIVKPDMHCFQTHWPDWSRADLRPNYVDDYRPYITQIREAAPALPLMIQADTGSHPENRRSWGWIAAFERACASQNICNTTFYEYSISGYIYTNPPRITEVRRRGNGVELLFNKQLDPYSASDPGHYRLSPGRVLDAKVDGSVVLVSLADVHPLDRGELTVRDVADNVNLRLFKDSPPAMLEKQSVRFRY